MHVLPCIALKSGLEFVSKPYDTTVEGIRRMRAWRASKISYIYIYGLAPLEEPFWKARAAVYLRRRKQKNIFENLSFQALPKPTKPVSLNIILHTTNSMAQNAFIPRMNMYTNVL